MLKSLHLLALGALIIAGAQAPNAAHAQPLPEPEPVPGRENPPLIPARGDPRRPVRPIPIIPDDGDPAPRDGGAPLVIVPDDKAPKFNPNGGDNSVGEDLPDGVQDGAANIENIIEWKTNFEQGIQCKKIPLDAKIRLDFNEITLGDMTKFISCITEQNFLLTGGANKAATVSILSPKPVTVYEAYKAYLSALEANGLTIVPNGSFLEIVPAGEARTKGAPIYGIDRSGPNTDQMVTRLIQLDHIPAEEILPVIDKFKTSSADVTVYGPTNTIIITDTGSNIRRILKLIKDLDVPIGKERIWIRPIVNASASEISALLEQIIGDGGGAAAGGAPPANGAAGRRAARQQRNAAAAAPASPDQSSVVGASSDMTKVSFSKMIADERTNSIIFVATRTAYLQVDAIIRKLDVAIPGEGSVHIHPLENADAEEIATTLSSLASGSGGGAGGGAGGRRAATPAGGAAAGATTGEMFSGEVKITAYKPKNSLVIESSLKDYIALQKVIRQLDVRRRQVYVEAIIMEISQIKDRNLGISGSAGTTFDVGGETIPLLFGLGGLGLDVGGAMETLQGGGGAIGLQGPLLEVDSGSSTGGASGGTFSIPAFGFTLKAIQTTTNVNVLSTPHILTLENEEAEIQVGRRQPYRNFGGGGGGGLGGLGSLLGGAGGAGGGLGGALGGLGLGGLGGLGGMMGGLGAQFQYVDVDLTLKIKPTVNASDFVRMEIDQSIDDIEGFVDTAPITSKRKIKNVVEVRDGQAVVIGGLIRDQETETVSKVPFLGDIPLLGLLFRRTKTTFEKRNLLLIIIPHVIKDPSDLKRIYEKRQAEYSEFAKLMAERKKEVNGDLDYRKKSGVVHDIYVTVEEARLDRELRERAIYDATDIDPVGPPETHDIEYDPRQLIDGKGDSGSSRGGN